MHLIQIKILKNVMCYSINYFLIYLLIRAQTIKSEYLIDTPKCQIPDLKAWREDAREYFTIVPPDLCSNKRLLTYVIQNETYAKVIVDEKAKKQYSQTPITCCYLWIGRSTSAPVPDTSLTLSPQCKYFTKELAINNRSVLVKCYDKNSLIYDNVHTAVTVDDKQYKKIVKARKSKDNKPLSLLIIGIDSVSRLNFHRTMPSTRAFMLENNWIEYKGYNKMGDNTFPNLMAMLTGKNVSYIDEHCDPTVRGQLEKCPFIWNSFKRYGFVTAYAEDAEFMATFNYLKKGFVRQPTDFYFKPFMRAARTLKGDGECTGPVHDSERILKIIESFLDTFLGYRFFGLFWMNKFSHDYLNGPTKMDKKVVTFFEKLKSKQVFDEVMVIFVSDHGMRFGNILLTTGGWYESRLPFLYFSIPPWFKDKHPKQYKNIRDNSKALTSPYDVYMTIQDVLVLSNFSYKPIQPDSCSLCQSLFKSIENPRTCAEIGIDSNWCTCVKFYPAQIKDYYVKKAAFAALLWIQEQILLLSPERFHRCVDYMLGEIISAGISNRRPYESGTGLSKVRLRVVFQTEPKAHFDAIVAFVMDSTATLISEDTIESLEVESVDRVDRYGNTSDCMDVKILKNYCYCKNRVANNNK